MTTSIFFIQAGPVRPSYVEQCMIGLLLYNKCLDISKKEMYLGVNFMIAELGLVTEVTLCAMPLGNLV